MLRVIASVAACLLASSCASLGTANVDPGYRPGAAGVLVASVSASGFTPGKLWYQVVRARAVTETVASIPVNDPAHGLDWQSGDAEVPNGGIGRIAVIELSPGEYELRRWVMGRSTHGSFSSRRPFGYRFVIEAGKVTYVGSVHVDLQRTADADTLPYRISLDDRRERDLAIVRRKYPGLGTTPVSFADGVAPRGQIDPEPAQSPVRTPIDDLHNLLPNK